MQPAANAITRSTGDIVLGTLNASVQPILFENEAAINLQQCLSTGLLAQGVSHFDNLVELVAQRTK